MSKSSQVNTRHCQGLAALVCSSHKQVKKIWYLQILHKDPVQSIMYSIQNTTLDDLDFICQLFDQAIVYQKTKGYPVWKGYDVEVLRADINQQLQFKIVQSDQILCVFSICFADTIIWREKDKGDAMYLHRIVVNPLFKGQKQFEKIMKWAVQYAQDLNLHYLRMDTWGDNQNIIDYYQSFGFKIYEYYTTPTTEELPLQHRNLYIALLEYPVRLTSN